MLNEFNQAVILKAAASFIIIGLSVVIKRYILKIMHSKIKEIKDYYNYKKIMDYLTGMFGFLVISVIWVDDIGSLSTFIGIITAGIAIALKDLISNIAAWLFIVTRKPFDVGDRIEIGESSGDVIDIRLFQFTLNEIGKWIDGEQSTGRVVHIPNSKVFTSHLANYTREFEYIWNEIPVLVTFESDWEKAKKIFEKIASEHCENLNEQAREKLKDASKKYMIIYNKLTPIVYVSVQDSGVLLTIRYLCNPRRKRSSSDAIWQELLRAVAKNEDIDLAYKTERRVLK